VAEDARAAAGRDDAAVPPAELGRGARAGGSAASRALPAAGPRSLLAFPWAVPGRAEQPAAPPAPGGAALDASGLNKAPGEGTEAPAAAAALTGGHRNLGQAALQDVEPAGTPEGQDVAAPKGRQVTLLDRIFRLEKGRGRTRGDPEEGRQGLDVPNGGIVAGAPNGEPLGKANECSQKELGQDSAGERGPAAAAPAGAQVGQDSPQAAAGQGSVMSFLKTLVTNTCSKHSPAPAVVHKGSKAEKGPGGQPGPKAAAESPSKGAKKKKAESPKLGHSTFSKLFRHKAAKETQQTTNTKSPEQPPATCVKADRNVPPSQEAPAKQNPKAPEAAAPPQGVSTEPPREGSKDKGSATPLPLSKLFWKKVLGLGAGTSGLALELIPAKPTTGSSVQHQGVQRQPHVSSIKGMNLSTLNATEKPLAPSESDPGGPRSKEGSKDKKSTVELGKQKGREQPEPREQPAADPDSIHNGGDAKEPSCKKTEKRQSLGGFFKGL
ncbi:BCAS1 protein, partial [Prunella himalayana]|nr:BCAS1 protein [Prunella himalayana]